MIIKGYTVCIRSQTLKSLSPHLSLKHSEFWKTAKKCVLLIGQGPLYVKKCQTRGAEGARFRAKTSTDNITDKLYGLPSIKNPVLFSG